MLIKRAMKSWSFLRFSSKLSRPFGSGVSIRQRGHLMSLKTSSNLF
jgi:hypothetical protein